MNPLRAGRRVAPAIAIVMGLVLAACGGASTTREPVSVDGPSGTSGAPAQTAAATGIEGPDGLCSLLPPAAAEAALGEPTGAGQPDRSTTFSNAYHCRYTGSGSQNVLDIEFDPDKTREEWDEDMLGTGMDDETALTGLGEAAWRSDDAALGPGTRLAAFTGGSSIWVVIAKDGDPEAMYAAVEQVAKDLLAQLPEPPKGGVAPTIVAEP